MTELIKQEALTAAIFSDEGKIESLVLDVESRVSDYIYDVDTKGGRKDIASFALKIAKCKTAIDGLGKDLVADAKKEIKLIDNKRKFARDKLDALKESFRKPLTDLEDAEKARVQSLNDGINSIREDGERVVLEWINYSVQELNDLLVSTEQKDDGTWEEFNDAAVKVITEAVKNINTAITKRSQYDIEQEQLAALKRQEEEKAQKERDERIAKEAVEKALNQQKIEPVKEEVVTTETLSKADINNSAKDALISHTGISQQAAKDIIIAIARGQIPHVSIKY
jgi:hypothetical protein